MSRNIFSRNAKRRKAEPAASNGGALMPLPPTGPATVPAVRPIPVAQAKSGRRAAKKPSIPSLISADLKVRGDLISDGEIQVDGKVEGDVRGEAITIGEDATINGTAEGDRITVLGTVVGKIAAKVVQLSKSARVSGKILHESMSIEKGATVLAEVGHLNGNGTGNGSGNGKDGDPMADVPFAHAVISDADVSIAETGPLRKPTLPLLPAPSGDDSEWVYVPPPPTMRR